jgi:hypothetical protein
VIVLREPNVIVVILGTQVLSTSGANADGLSRGQRGMRFTRIPGSFYVRSSSLVESSCLMWSLRLLWIFGVFDSPNCVLLSFLVSSVLKVETSTQSDRIVED